MTRFLLCTLAALAVTIPASARRGAGASQRFTAADVKEVPGFQRHVVPLLDRLGYNSQACHGCFQGQGGFRLSLFGYNFAADPPGPAPAGP